VSGEAYRPSIWAGINEGISDNLRTGLADLQSVYHDIHTGSLVGEPHARSGEMEITTTEQDAYTFGPPVLESDPAQDIPDNGWDRELYEELGPECDPPEIDIDIER